MTRTVSPRAANTKSIIVLVYDELPPSLNTLLRKHWTFEQAAKKKWTWLTRAQTSDAIAEPCEANVVFRTIREMDEDNLHGRCKVLLDAIKRAGVITDDNPRVLALKARQEKVPHRKDTGTIVELVERLPFDEPLPRGDGHGIQYAP